MLKATLAEQFQARSRALNAGESTALVSGSGTSPVAGPRVVKSVILSATIYIYKYIHLSREVAPNAQSLSLSYMWLLRMSYV